MKTYAKLAIVLSVLLVIALGVGCASSRVRIVYPDITPTTRPTREVVATPTLRGSTRAAGSNASTRTAPISSFSFDLLDGKVTVHISDRNGCAVARYQWNSTNVTDAEIMAATIAAESETFKLNSKRGVAEVCLQRAIDEGG